MIKYFILSEKFTLTIGDIRLCIITENRLDARTNTHTYVFVGIHMRSMCHGSDHEQELKDSILFWWIYI